MCVVQTLPPQANTTFSVVYLGRREGPVSAHLYIHTSLGVHKYPVSARLGRSAPPAALRPGADLVACAGVGRGRGQRLRRVAAGGRARAAQRDRGAAAHAAQPHRAPHTSEWRSALGGWWPGGQAGRRDVRSCCR